MDTPKDSTRKSYRELAAKCREMAAHSAKPAPLVIDIAGRFTPFTPIFNITGQPAISIPAGVGGDGLPLAVQLVGRVGAEDTLFSLAAQIEAAAPWAQRRPTVS